VTFHVSRTSSSHAVAACLRKAIMAWGVPEIVRTDNGQDYVSWHIERVLLDLEIIHDVCRPFCPEEKPFVERVFGSFLRDNIESLIGYSGHNVSQRKDIEARESFARRMMDRKDIQTINMNLSPEELQDICDRWANDAYMHRRHSTLKCSPYEQTLAYDGAVKRIEDAEALRLLMLPYIKGNGTRKVNKDGGIRAFNDKFIAPELALYARRTVQVRVDDERRDVLHVYNLDGTEFICAARGSNFLSQDEIRNVSNHAKRLQAASMGDQKAAMAAADKVMKTGDVVYERMIFNEQRARKIEDEHPLRAQVHGIHSTPALEGAAEAARVPDYTPAPETEREKEFRRTMREQAAREQEAAQAPQETPRDRFSRYQSLSERKERGEELTPDELRWIGSYGRTAECDAQERLYAVYGLPLAANAG